MAKERVGELLVLLDNAFEGREWHSLLTNLGSTKPDDWDWVPPNGARTIHELVMHVGACKYLYHNQAFGDAHLPWADISRDAHAACVDLPTALPWLRAGHALLHQSIAELNDDDLAQLRPHHMGTPRETRWIIMITTQHDLYHAGEINHIRALHQGNDAWD